MKVCLLCPTYYPSGGGTHYILGLASRLEELGFEISVVTNTAKSVLEEKLPYPLGSIDFFEAAHPTGKPFSFYQMIKSIKKIMNQKELEKVDIFHAHTQAYFLGVSSSKRTNAKMIYTLHGSLPSVAYYEKQVMPLFYTLLEFLCVRKSHATIAVTDFTREVMSKFYGEKFNRKCKVIYNGVDPELFKNFEVEKSHEGFPILLAIGPLIKSRKIEYAIKCLPSVKKKHPNTMLLIAGNGPNKNNLIKLANKLKVKDNVIFLNHVNYEDLPSLINMSDICLNFTFDVPRSLFEEMACEKPVISFSYASFPKVIENGMNGVLVTPHDLNEVSKHIEILANSDSLRRKIGKNARKTIIENYTEEKIVMMHKEVYEEESVL
jgi:glycosyltransferase involved in cell wall biosynthesis